MKMITQTQFNNQVGKINRELNHLLSIYQNHAIKNMDYDPMVENMIKTILFSNDNLMYRLRSDQK